MRQRSNSFAVQCIRLALLVAGLGRQALADHGLPASSGWARIAPTAALVPAQLTVCASRCSRCALLRQGNASAACTTQCVRSHRPSSSSKLAPARWRC